MSELEQIFAQHGYIILFVGLLLEFIGLPFPGETTLCFAGYLSYEGHLNFLILILVAFLGTTIGMTITYVVGKRFGYPFINKYGKYMFLSNEKIESTSKWYGKYGNFLIFIGYFIPGVRHFTGYFAGVLKLSFKKFMVYAYLGAFFWVVLFLSVGKIFGPNWKVLFDLVHKYTMEAAIVFGVLFGFYLLFHYRKKIAKLFLKKQK